MNKDSVQKIITTYFSLLTAEPFEYQNTTYSPTPISISKSLLRELVCHKNCAACCRNFTLDWLPTEKMPYAAQKRLITLNNKQYEIYTDTNQTEFFCKYLNQEGRCKIHTYNPLSCDFEIIRLIKAEKPYITSTYYGRSWNMTKITGERGAECEIIPPTEKTINDIKRKFNRLENWFNHFEIKSKIPSVIQWIDSNNHKKTIL